MMADPSDYEMKLCVRRIPNCKIDILWTFFGRLKVRLRLKSKYDARVHSTSETFGEEVAQELGTRALIWHWKMGAWVPQGHDLSIRPGQARMTI